MKLISLTFDVIFLHLVFKLYIQGIEGVIIGRALYDGRIDPAAALALARG
jgi:phosphoribosylformimino-5-aminoimidazole carboxamide ribonucleotide (ProFAR) isomerase